MYSVEECRTRAQECVELAQSAREPEKATLLKLAQDWLVLTDEMASLPHTAGRSADREERAGG